MSHSIPVGTASPAETVPSLRERVVGVLRSPAETFRRMTDADAWFWPAIFLLIGYTLYYLAYGVGGARWQVGWMSSLWQSSGASPSPESEQTMPTVLSWLAPALQLFGNVLQVPLTVAVSWTLRTLTFYGLARLFGGERPFWGRVVTMVGWAWLPLFFQYALTGVLMLLLPQVMGFFLPLPSGHELGHTAHSMRSNWQGPMLFYLSPFVFWNLALCAIGVAEVFQLPRWKATLVVLIPAVAQLLFMLAGYFLSAAMMQSFGTTPGNTPQPPPTP